MKLIRNNGEGLFVARSFRKLARRQRKLVPVFTPTLFMPTAAATYTGPGDVVASAAGWWGLRAYTAASIGSNVVKVRRSSDNTTKIFVSIAGGGINTSDAFFDGSNYFVDTLYDQSGNGNDMIQSTQANQPALILTGIGSKPVIQTVSATSRLPILAGPTVAAPATLVYAGARVFNSSYQAVMAFGAGGGSSVGFNNTANNVFEYGGVVAVAAATDANWHAVQNMFSGVVNTSSINVDGVLTGSLNAGTQGFAGNEIALTDGSNPLHPGAFVEVGFWSGNFSGGQQSSMNTNLQNYWNWSAYDVATQAWVLNVMGNGGIVSSAQQGYVDTLIKGLKSDGVWSKLDRLWLYAAENATAASVDLVADAVHTLRSTPTFAVDRGYTGVDQSTTIAIDTNYNPGTNAINYTQNSAHVSAWLVNYNTPSNNARLFGTQSFGFSFAVFIFFNVSDQIITYMNDVTGSAGAVPTTKTGHWLSNRTGASASQLYQNGANFSSPNTVSVPIANNHSMLSLAGWEGGSGTQVNGLGNQLAMLSIGGGLSSTDASNLYNRLRTYMTAVGVP